MYMAWCWEKSSPYRNPVKIHFQHTLIAFGVCNAVVSASLFLRECVCICIRDDSGTKIP